MALIPVRTYCSCGCGTVIFEGKTKTVPVLVENFVYEFDGELDYIELFVPGHQPAKVEGPRWYLLPLDKSAAEVVD